MLECSPALKNVHAGYQWGPFTGVGNICAVSGQLHT